MQKELANLYGGYPKTWKEIYLCQQNKPKPTELLITSQIQIIKKKLALKYSESVTLNIKSSMFLIKNSTGPPRIHQRKSGSLLSSYAFISKPYFIRLTPRCSQSGIWAIKDNTN